MQGDDQDKCAGYRHICRAKCCRGFYIIAPYDTTLDKYFRLHLSPEEYESWRKNKLEFFIKRPCKWLGPDLTCINYSERPVCCKKWKCEYLKSLLALDAKEN